MHNTIGETAGKVWSVLNENGETTLAKLKKETGEDGFSVDAAIGWLARENKVEIAKAGRSYKVALVLEELAA